MSVWLTVEGACPQCAQRLPLRVPGGGVPSGQDSDLFVRMRGRHVIHAAIHTCPRCRFSGYCEDFQGGRWKDSLRARFAADVDALLEGESPSFVVAPPTAKPFPHLQYRLAAAAAECAGMEAREIARRAVRAYWSLRLAPYRGVDPTVLEATRELTLREAVAKLREPRVVDREPPSVYLTGELARRLGRFDLARRYLERYLAREGGPRYLKIAGEKLIERARAGDRSERTMEELLYDQTPGAPRSDRAE